MDYDNLIKRLKIKDFTPCSECNPYQCTVFELLDEAADVIKYLKKDRDKWCNKYGELFIQTIINNTENK